MLEAPNKTRDGTRFRTRWWATATVTGLCAFAAVAPFAAGWPQPRARAATAATTGQTTGAMTELATVSVSNPMPAGRAHETITLARAEITRVAPSFDIKNVQIADAA